MAAANQQSTQFAQFCIQYSSLALLYYDYILTFPLEVKYMWRKKVMISTVLYWFCRYALLANLFYLLVIANVVNNCTGWYQFDGYLSIAGRAAVLGVFAFRTYAVWDRSKFIAAIMGTLWIITMAFDFWHVTGDKCQGTDSASTIIANTSLAVANCVFECVGTLLTTMRCLKARQMYKLYAQGPQKDGIFDFMLREGLIYFFVVIGFTFTAVVLNFQAPEWQSNLYLSASSLASDTPDAATLGKFLNALTLPVSGILSARLLLYLRQQSSRQETWALQGGRPRTDAFMDDDDAIALSTFHAATMESEPANGVVSIFVSRSDPIPHGTGEFGGDPMADVTALLENAVRVKVDVETQKTRTSCKAPS
ncbi:hypothetical protein CONPUDRAFT_141545 [Coniophora puteana RWD-64-598 SS2]|uniref:DUF6533 domain-containing protein n=1 Tax=Coniophora puteana (strain RWD-64-598) TaxID=741705 RepID=A0A5M3N805_CONPW|nr:uncharacterized protein CONPUDRAFT_141545 [Coniophora puteana RWD-64-598 SS2]EIW87446.1 hypothetical protein CONPUDRAFT_141545 [Coniophora puteana RWD-64-598 SS2]